VFDWCLHGLALNAGIPGVLKLLPTALRLRAHLDIADDHVVVAVFGQLALAHISAHGNVNHQPEVFHPPSSRRNAPLHYRPAIDVPDHTSPPVRNAVLFYPRKAKIMRLACHRGKVRLNNTVLAVVLAVEVSPVQARVIDAVAVP